MVIQSIHLFLKKSLWSLCPECLYVHVEQNNIINWIFKPSTITVSIVNMCQALQHT